MKFSTKLILLYLIFTLGSIIPISSFIFYSGYQATEKQIKEHLQERATHFMDKIDRILFERSADIQMLASDPSFNNPNTTQPNLNQRLLDYRNAYKVYISLSFFDADKVRIADTAGLSIGQTAHDSRWVQDVFDKGIISVGADIHFEDELVILFVAAPVRDKADNIIGAVVARMPLERLYILSTFGHKDENISIDLVDQNGLLLYSNTSSKLLQKIITLDSLEQVFNDKEIFYTIAKEQGFLTFVGNQWTLIVHYSNHKAFDVMITLRNQAFIWGLCLLLIAIISLFFFANKIIQPIIALKDAAIKFGQGDFTSKVPVHSHGDEISELAIVFNKVADMLAEQMEELKTSNEALYKSEERFDLALRGSNDGLWDWNLVTNEIYFSPRWKSMLGYADHEINNQLEEFNRLLHPDDVQPTFAKINSYIDKKISKYEFYFRMRHKKDYYVWLLDRGFAIWNEQGKAIRFVGTHVDMTAEKEAEARLNDTIKRVKQSERLLKIVIDATPDLIFVKDTDYRYLLVNKSFAQAMNTTTEQMFGKNDLEVGLLKEQIFGDIEQGINGFRTDDKEALSGKILHNPYVPLTFADGNLHIFDTIKIPMYNESHSIFAMLGYSRDITERNKIDVALLLAKETAEQAKIEAETANYAKSTFLANMSHELRTPLNGILGYTQILSRDKTLSDKQQEGIGIIQRSGDYLLTLINDILDLSKIEAGKIELYFVDFNFERFIQEISELFQMRVEQKGIAFIYEPMSHLPVGVNGDEKRLRQVMINLLGNAVKFTEQGGINLKIGYQNGKIRFQIEDTGTGIAKDELEKIFLPFQQVGDQNYRAEGTGLGLSITKKLVEMMGGELHVESTFGQGSTFWLELKLPEVKNLIKSDTKPKPVIISFEGLQKTILVIDDKWENRSVLSNLLIPLGFEIIEVKNGKEGLTHLPVTDLVITDLVMPVMDGFEFTRQLRNSEFKTIPIIAASASVFDFHQQESLDAGCNDFLPKPIRFEILLEQLQTHLGLTWVYDVSTHDDSIEIPSTEEESTIIIGPSPKQASVLFDLAMMGDIGGIIEQIDKLEAADNKLRVFCSKIRQLAKDFAEEQICELVEKYME